MEGATLSLWRSLNPTLFMTGMAVLAVAGAAAAAGAYTRAGRRVADGIFPSERRVTRTVVALAVIYFLVYSYLSILRYHKLMAWSWDLGIFESLMANALSGRLFLDYRGPFDHFDPAVYLYLPLYALWRDPRVLLAAQAAVLALAAWPLYLLAKQVSGSKSLGAVMAAVYLLYPLLGSGNLHDFHAVSLTPLFFFSAVLFAERGRWGWYWVFAVLLLSVKETEAILIFAMGLHLLSRRRYLHGAISVVLSLVWVAVSLWVVIPWIMGEEYWHFGFFGGVAETAGWVVEAEGTTAMLIMRRILQAVSVLFFALIPISFLPARRMKGFVLLFLPVIGVYLLSNNWALRTVSGHYGLSVTAAALAAAALALEGVGEWGEARRRALVTFVIVTALLCNVLYSFPANRRWAYPSVRFELSDSFNVLSMPLPTSRARRAFYRITPHERFFHAARRAVPPGASVATQRNLGAFFAVGYELEDLGPDVSADYYLFDFAEDYGTNTDGLRRFAAALQGRGDLVRFLQVGRAEETTFAFYARGDEWVAFYERALAHAADGDTYAMKVTEALEETMRLQRRLGGPQAH